MAYTFELSWAEVKYAIRISRIMVLYLWSCYFYAHCLQLYVMLMRTNENPSSENRIFTCLRFGSPSELGVSSTVVSSRVLLSRCSLVTRPPAECAMG